MGAWGTGIFDDDVAADVADLWNDAIGGGPAQATQTVYDELGEAIEDDDDGPIAFFALASLQLDAGHLDDRVRETALSSIEPNLERWADDGSPEDVEERRRVLEELRQRINSFADPS